METSIAAGSDRLHLIDQLEAHFLQRPGRWLNALTLSRVGGALAWRSRVSDLRTERGMRIENRQRRRATPGGRVLIVSEYRYLPERPAGLR